MSRSEHEMRQLDQQYGRVEDRRQTGRCPVHGCLLIIGRNGEVFDKPICPNCEEQIK